MHNQTNPFMGAWLTDIDDTLIPSGVRPDDEWIEQLANFIRKLKAHNIVWAPVSGVAIPKMGPRMLFRLPEDVLSHVLYYGGEGSTRSYYDPETKQWCNVESFQRNFSDAQAITVIGQTRFVDYLKVFYKNENDVRITDRINAALKVLNASEFKSAPNIVDSMQELLIEDGFNADQSETYFRGGAISWMMMGDISVEHYRGEKETKTRARINDFVWQRLADINYLESIGESGIHMPYPNATRGIKLVLKGNDKGRAAEDLISNEGISPHSILFVGNEVYAGGNDNSVRRIDGIHILSVGEHEDPGVIKGGVQTGANKFWMSRITGQLESGKTWRGILDALPQDAVIEVLMMRIDKEKETARKVSEWHRIMSDALPTSLLARLDQRYSDVFRETRQKLIEIKKIEYGLVARLAVLEMYHYDNARKIVLDLLLSDKRSSDSGVLTDRFKSYLLPEVKALIQKLLVEQFDLDDRKVANTLRAVKNLDGMRATLDNIINGGLVQNPGEELERVMTVVSRWENRIESLIESYFTKLEEWRDQRRQEAKLINNDENVKNEIDASISNDLYKYLRWLVPRLIDIPHLKDLDKPTIVLVSGTSGVGKSTITKHVSKVMGIPTSFSSDVASRSVMREALKFIIGNARAKSIFPELFGSSFDEDSLEWYYTHSMLTMVGVIGNIDRLIKEDVSAVIDGVALIPGTLPEEYFEIANIVWIVASVKDKEVHFERLGTRSETGVERGGAERYRKRYSAIRHNHDRLVEMATKSKILTVDNSGSIDTMLEEVIARIIDPFADRGLPVEDPIRDYVHHNLQERTTWEMQRNFVQHGNTNDCED